MFAAPFHFHRPQSLLTLAHPFKGSALNLDLSCQLLAQPVLVIEFDDRAANDSQWRVNTAKKTYNKNWLSIITLVLSLPPVLAVLSKRWPSLKGAADSSLYSNKATVQGVRGHKTASVLAILAITTRRRNVTKIG